MSTGTLNEACAQEPLNRDTSVDVEVMSAGSGQLRNNLSRRSGHLFHNTSAHGGQVDGPAAEDNNSLVAIGPDREVQNCFEGVAADHQGIDACYELVIAVGLAAACRQKVEIAVWSRNEAVDADPDKDRRRHPRLLPSREGALGLS
jgi:hypothetical protein